MHTGATKERGDYAGTIDAMHPEQAEGSQRMRRFEVAVCRDEDVEL